MNKLNVIIAILIIVFLASCGNSSNKSNLNQDTYQVKETNTKYGTFTDQRDSKTYKTVKIGNQIWMAENLAYNTGNDCWAYDNDQRNVAKYGYLYDWETAKKVCPQGWHLPSDNEWEQLAEYIKKDEETVSKDSYGHWQIMGIFLKAKSGWGAGDYGNGTDKYGFAALPGGKRYSNGDFSDDGRLGFWWSNSSENSSDAWSRDLRYGYTPFYRGYGSNKSWGFSVRCVGN